MVFWFQNGQDGVLAHVPIASPCAIETMYLVSTLVSLVFLLVTIHSLQIKILACNRVNWSRISLVFRFVAGRWLGAFDCMCVVS